MVAHVQRYEPVASHTTSRDSVTIRLRDDEQLFNNAQHPQKAHKRPKAWLPALSTWYRRQIRKSWRFGLFAGLYASLAVLASNTAFLLYGILTHGGVQDGIATIMQGNTKTMSYMSTALHVLINIMSTILLTSSNYAMQVLCAPTRDEINVAHEKGYWLEIGLMSFRNLSHINKKRALLWWLLALSSAPLHLFYNSAVFQVTSGQDYSITAVTHLDEPRSAEWTKMSNDGWIQTYSDAYVSGYTDLVLVMNNASSKVVVQSDWSFTFDSSSPIGCDWKNVSELSQVGLSATFNLSSKSFVPTRRDDYRIIYPVDDGTSYEFRLQNQWPDFQDVKVPSRLQDNLRLCTRTDGTKWLGTPFNASLRVEYAYAKTTSYGSKVQIGLPFLVIVIAANSVKIVCILCTLRTCSSGHIITVGDAVATFLETEDPGTTGKCMQTQQRLRGGSDKIQLQPWQPETRRMASIIGGKGLTVVNLGISVVLALCLLLMSLTRGFTTSWGTASKLTLDSTQFAFNARGAILTAWLANLPQAFLSFFYFSINRICTSICFAIEWNNYATKRKGLRVTSPQGEQRSTHFLQLPFRFAAPLTICSGILHWLLSQSLFLVRLEARSRDGKLVPTSLCACGYSVLSYLVFTLVLLILVVTIGSLLVRKIAVHVPPARHCSLIISAACHPPTDDRGCHLKAVQWGVVEEGTESVTGHCTFTSWDVQTLQKDVLYA